MLKFTAIALTATLLSAPAFASSECDNAQDQATMNQCANENFIKSDEQLNSHYREIEKRLSDNDDAKKLLVASQRAWIKFRDAECDFAASGTAGGSVQPMILAMCKDSLTTDRNKQFSEYLKCEEGDLSCPVPSGN
ncbi:lysozyme inhibitor LprI family protein [Brucella sp. BE17]|uniref:lysozyme inhibitor LprI family protein n=1 Tax=Brucella sp. BE17 TaxID=3142977 RepID=UPI0031BA8753